MALSLLYRHPTLTQEIRGDRTPTGRPLRATWRLHSLDVQHFEVTAIDANRVEPFLTSSLSEITASDWVASLSLGASHRHFVVTAYDEIIEVIARSCEFKPSP